MANMSYCRFENTFKSLRDCQDAIREGDDRIDNISRSEHEYRLELVKLCKSILEDCQCEIEEPEGGIENQFPPFEGVR